MDNHDSLGSAQAIVTFALSLVDALLFVHYAAVLLLEMRQLPARYYVHVIRSPDGVSRGYPVGAVSLCSLALRYRRWTSVRRPAPV